MIINPNTALEIYAINSRIDEAVTKHKRIRPINIIILVLNLIASLTAFDLKLKNLPENKNENNLNWEDFY